MNRIVGRNTRLPLAPMEGWVTLGLTLLLCLTLAWSLDFLARAVVGQCGVEFYYDEPLCQLAQAV